MKSKSIAITDKFSIAFYLVLCAMFVFSIALSTMAQAASAKEIDMSVDTALERFYKQVKGGKEIAGQAKGLLVMPNVKKAALIIGGEYGTGALRIDGKTVNYYNIVSGSFGLQIGAQAKDIVIAFMTNEALEHFRASKGWEAGVDGNVAMFKTGAGEVATSMTNKEPIVGFIYDVKGLIGDLSIKGAKFTKLDK